MFVEVLLVTNESIMFLIMTLALGNALYVLTIEELAPIKDLFMIFMNICGDDISIETVKFAFEKLPLKNKNIEGNN